jgi:hypothetical protein
MVSKKQAAAIGEALAQGNRSRPQGPSYHMRFYPELEKIPPDDRDVALKDAKKCALRSIPVVATSCLVLLLFAAICFSYEPGSDWLGPAITGIAGIASLWGFAFRWRVRRALLHSRWRPRSSPLSEVLHTSSDE